MRYGSIGGRLALFGPDATALDVAKASGDRFQSDPQAVYEVWDDFVEWASHARWDAALPFGPGDLDAPVPLPRQLFALALNYGSHASEVGFSPNHVPSVFTKFVSSITAPTASVPHPGGSVDWEVELVVVMGRKAQRATAESAWSYVAGLTAGQDLSERETQHAGTLPQFSLGKSFPGFSPMGPCVVTPDEFNDPDDLALGCAVNGRTVQDARTSEMSLSVPRLIERLSAIVTLLPGDVIYTGTPGGVGMSRTPPEFLSVGDVVRSWIEGVGELETTIVANDG